MKTLLCVLCVLCGSILSAADLQLTDGRVLHDATIVSQSASSVTVRHADGLASVPKAQLPEALRSQYPVTALPAPHSSLPASSGAAKARADEQARIAKAQAAREERAQWLKDNPQAHQVTYRVESTSPATRVTTVTPEGEKTFTHQGDNFGTWSQSFTALDGAYLKLGVAALTGKYASSATLVILVDGAEVRRETLEPRKGSLELAWQLGAADADQPAVARSSVANNDSGSAITDTSGNINGRIVRKDTGFTATRD